MIRTDIDTTEGLSLLNQLFKSATEGIILFDELGDIVLSNPSANQMFGYSPEEMKGLRVENLVPQKHRSSHETHRKNYTQHAEPRRMGTGRDLEGLRKNGSTFPLEISLSYTEDLDKKHVVAFITDITVRKEHEKKLAEQRGKLEEYTTELENKVKARTSELEHLNLGLESQIQERKLAEAALKDSMKELSQAKQDVQNSLEKEMQLGELKSRFVSMASHEFRTPLTTILSSANLITKYTTSEQQTSREKHVNRIKKSVENLTNILNDFLSIEKLESGAEKVMLDTVNLNALILEVKEEMAQYLKKGQHIVYQEREIIIASDPHILKNILINLISNASKYSSEAKPIEIDTHLGNEVTIGVKDHGIGIPKEEQKNLFGRFYRAGNATNIQGTGLGLNIVQKYVQLLDGDITFTSEEGKGSTFVVRLPQS